MNEAMSDTRTAEADVNGTDAGARAIDGAVSVRVANGPLVAPALRRLVSIVLARADWPLDGLDDALLVCDALSAHAPAHARAGRLTLSMRANEHEAELRVGELCRGGAAGLLGDARLPVVGNVLESIAEDVSVLDEPDGGSALALVLRTCSQPRSAPEL
jgi:hypothetical protein